MGTEEGLRLLGVPMNAGSRDDVSRMVEARMLSKNHLAKPPEEERISHNSHE